MSDKDPDGILLIDKPAGISSAQALSIVKRNLRIKRMGHAGTLDPFATGLLIALCGKATRFAQFAQAGSKIYSGILRLGLKTSSEDITGSIVRECSDIPDPLTVKKCAESYLGLISQVPPKVSAIKINGVRAYELARSEKEFTIEPKNVTLFSYRLEPTDSPDRYYFQLETSKGFYVRSWARDIGDSLGCGGCLETLRRERSAPYDVAQAQSVEKVSLDKLIPWQSIFDASPRLRVNAQEFEGLRSGLLKIPSVLSQLAQLDVPSSSLLVYEQESSGSPGGVLRYSEGQYSFVVNVS